jgi:hypothetical protein
MFGSAWSSGDRRALRDANDHTNIEFSSNG